VVDVPDEYTGSVVGDLNSRRGRIAEIESKGAAQKVQAFVPLSEMFGYVNELRSVTQGRATYSMHFERYEKIPGNLAEELIAKAQGKLK
jgi:elongation factor G